MEGCKHWPQKERPEEFANALKSYLDRKTENYGVYLTFNNLNISKYNI
jgi:hypothetical protein